MASAGAMGSQPQLGILQQAMPGPAPYDADGRGVQVRPMCLKVHYTFDKDSQVRCLARWPQVLQIRAVPLDEQNSIGLVELATCLQAVAQGSPEIVGQPNIDYTVYAYDYSEPDTPLVGQGILAWALESGIDSPSPPMLTGRVTRNPLAVFSSGVGETLEVRLKLTAVPKMHRPGATSLSDPQNMARSVPTPTDATSEWSSFLQANPSLGRSVPIVSVPSPATVAPGHTQGAAGGRVSTPNAVLLPQQATGQAAAGPLNVMPEARPLAPRRGSLPPSLPHIMPSPTIESARLAPSDDVPTLPPPVGTTQPSKQSTGQTSRPSSRASSRPRKPKPRTGNPRGRPRKNPIQTGPQNGNTSAAEDVTDVDDGPQKKRAKIIKADFPASGPFGTAPDSLRVAASTAGSLRNMRPVGLTQDPTAASHLQEVPRAPTPVPQGPLGPRQRKPSTLANLRRQSTLGPQSPTADEELQQSEDPKGSILQAHSPGDSVAVASADEASTPADSPADVGSSPPVPRTSAYLRSSPPHVQSSPVLPPMPAPMPRMDSGFMSGGIDDLFDDEETPQELPPAVFVPKPAVPMADMHPDSGFTDLPTRSEADGLDFRVEKPGPPELLPTTSIFKPHGAVKRLNNPNAKPRPRPAAARLARANTDPMPVVPLSRPASQLSAPACDPLPDLLVLPDAGVGTANSVHVAETMESLGNGDMANQDDPEDLMMLLNEAMAHKQASVAAFSSAPALGLTDHVEPPNMFPPVPASDPVRAFAATQLSQGFRSDAPCPPSDGVEVVRLNKNVVKKLTIKEKLQEAIAKGEMPPFCQNCGAIETPTWRKIWTQDHDGVPGYHDYSEKAGHVTAIEILERDEDGKPKLHRLIKKNLGPEDDKKEWKEQLLCNPCGIWLVKCKNHRPPDRWDKDAARLNQNRKRREYKPPTASRSKKARTQSEGQVNPTSEAYFTTDPIGLGDGEDDSPPDVEAGDGMVALDLVQSLVREDSSGGEQGPRESQPGLFRMPSHVGSPRSLGIGSTHSRPSRAVSRAGSRAGSGTADSPVQIDDDLGATRRLLFPSPRRDGVAKVLGEVAVNVVQLGLDHLVSPKAAVADKENVSTVRRGAHNLLLHDDMLDQELFGTPPVRPSTPPSKAVSASSAPFKTPTRATPAQHRPITRSVSRTIQSAKSMAKTPGQLDQLLLQTPSKTPRSSAAGSSSVLRRRSPRRFPQQQQQQQQVADFAIDDEDLVHHPFQSPFTATLHQLLSEANDFTADSSSHGLADLDLHSLPHLDSDDIHGHHGHHHHLTAAGGAIDFAALFSTDAIMPSSPTLLRSVSGSTALSGATLDALAGSRLGKDGRDKNSSKTGGGGTVR